MQEEHFCDFIYSFTVFISFFIYLQLLYLTRMAAVSPSPGGMAIRGRLCGSGAAGEECGSRNCSGCHRESCDPPGSGSDPAEERRPNWPLFAYGAPSPR